MSWLGISSLRCDPVDRIDSLSAATDATVTRQGFSDINLRPLWLTSFSRLLPEVDFFILTSRGPSFALARLSTRRVRRRQQGIEFLRGCTSYPHLLHSVALSAWGGNVSVAQSQDPGSWRAGGVVRPYEADAVVGRTHGINVVCLRGKFPLGQVCT